MKKSDQIKVLGNGTRIRITLRQDGEKEYSILEKVDDLMASSEILERVSTRFKEILQKSIRKILCNFYGNSTVTNFSVELQLDFQNGTKSSSQKGVFSMINNSRLRRVMCCTCGEVVYVGLDNICPECMENNVHTPTH